MGYTTNSNGGYLKKNRFEWGRGFLSIIFLRLSQTASTNPNHGHIPILCPLYAHGPLYTSPHCIPVIGVICPLWLYPDCIFPFPRPHWPSQCACPLEGTVAHWVSFPGEERPKQLTSQQFSEPVVWKMSWQNTNLYNSIYSQKSIIAWIFWFHVATLSTKCDTAGQPHTAVRQVLKVGLRRKNSVQNVCNTADIIWSDV